MAEVTEPRKGFYKSLIGCVLFLLIEGLPWSHQDLLQFKYFISLTPVPHFILVSCITSFDRGERLRNIRVQILPCIQGNSEGLSQLQTSHGISQGLCGKGIIIHSLPLPVSLPPLEVLFLVAPAPPQQNPCMYQSKTRAGQ